MLQLFSVSDDLLLHVGPCCLILHLNTLAEVFYILIGCWFVHVLRLWSSVSMLRLVCVPVHHTTCDFV